jgi:Leucine-rich repeat (LRR) protein
MDNSDSEYDTTFITLRNYNLEDKNNVLSNLKYYTKLKSFDCSKCDLVELPENLPNSLETLICSFNRLTRLPNLDNLTQLQFLWCNNNILSHLPSLSNLTKLELLNCSVNNLIKLPEKLPNSIQFLYCWINKLEELPEILPKSLFHLHCYHNKLKLLPDLPDSLIYLNSNDNHKDFKLNYPNFKIITINEINGINRNLKRLKLLDRTLLLEHSAKICLHPKRIERLLNTKEIDFFDGSFDYI